MTAKKLYGPRLLPGPCFFGLFGREQALCPKGISRLRGQEMSRVTLSKRNQGSAVILSLRSVKRIRERQGEPQCDSRGLGW